MTSLISTGVENTFGGRQKPSRLLGRKQEDTIQGIVVEHIDVHEGKSAGGGHGEGEGTWIYSFADLIMNLLMFFVMMFAISSIDKNKLAQVQEAFSSKNHPKSSGKTDAGNTGGVTASGWTPKESMSNAEILEKVKELMGRIDDGFLKTNAKMTKDVLTLKSQLDQLSKKVEVEWRDRPDLQGFDIAIPAKKIFVTNGTRVELSKTGAEFVRKISSELGALKHQLKINVVSFSDGRNVNSFEEQSRRANLIASQLTSQKLLSTSEITASGVNSNSVVALGNEKTLGRDPILIRVSALLPSGGLKK